MACASSRVSESQIISSSSIPTVKGVPLKLWSSTARAYPSVVRHTPPAMEIADSLTEQKSLLAVLPPGKRARLHRLLFEFGPGSGTLLLLPIDQGIEHGPRDFFPNPASKDPEYQFRLAAEAGYSAIACQIGLAEKYYPDYAGQVPLILKVNGRTDVPPPTTRCRRRTPRSRTPSASAPTRSATRCTSAAPSRPTTCTS